MRTVFRSTGICLIFLLLSSALASQEIRLGVQYEKEILPKLEIDGEFQFRLADPSPAQTYMIFQAGLGYEIFKNLSVGGTFRYSPVTWSSNELQGSEIDEKLRYTLDLKHKSDWINENLRIRNRIRYQHSSIISGVSKDYIRYRLAMDYKFNQDVRPYLALEPYVALDDLEIARVRLYLGGNLEILRNELKVYFIIEGRERNSSFSSNYILGLSYNF